MQKALLFLVALFLLVSCDALKLKDRGGEGDACFTDNTCKEPYECIDGTCVKKTHNDEDALAETDDEMVVGDDEGEDDQSDQTDDVTENATDEDLVSDDDSSDDLSDQTGQSDQSDPSDVDDTVIVTDDAAGLDDDVIPVDDTVTPDDDTTDVTPIDDTEVADDTAPIDDDIVEIDDGTPTDDAAIPDDDAPEIRTFTCAAKPAHTDWNSVSDYEQIWNGAAWEPADDPTTEYNPTADTASCRYKCEAGYYWNGSYCVNNKVICTGQTLCYDNTTTMTCPSWNAVFTGQDAQYLVQCEPRNYSIEGAPNNDVVVDNRTELMWQRTFLPTYDGCTAGTPTGTKCTWQEAVNHCDKLIYGGYNDWRLPTRKELATLPDYGKSNPAIDTAIFPATQSSYYWSSSVKEGVSASAWFVYFYHGYIDTTAKTNPYDVRCVRGGILPDSGAFTEATVGGKIIVTDAATGLQWTKEYLSSMDWQAALNHCETLNYGDATDWRLPNINELAMLVDDTASGPASAFPGIAAAIFWSSSTGHYANDDAWYVNFDTGLISYDAKTAARSAICVRSPVDECMKWNNPCNDTGDTAGACTDTATGYTCECTDYYFEFFNGSCRDIDECMSIQFCNYNGDTLATCTNTSPGYDCGCSEGFEISYTTYPATPEYPTCVALPPPTGVLCTGQTLCYNATEEMTCPAEGNAFYGQDAQYALLGECVPRDYTVSGTAGNDIVTDNVTGLIWQRTLPATYAGCTGGAPTGANCTWQQSVDYCNGLNYGGQVDWRLPTMKELATLVDYGEFSPAIDETIFPATPADGLFWSSSEYINNTSNAWYAYLYNGDVGSDAKSSSYLYYARCVRGDPVPESVFAESTVSGKVIVTDSTTGLIWTKEYASMDKDWENALYYCESLDYAGYTDWRLPDLAELRSLIDCSGYNPASGFPEMPSQYFWSSSSCVFSASKAWVVSFNSGSILRPDKTIAYNARCVR